MTRSLDDRSVRLRPQIRWVAVPALLALGALSACGGTSTDASNAPSEVASLDAEADSSGSDAEDNSLDPDEAALEFSQCLRDAGLDVADIGVNADGNVDLRGALDNVDRSDPAIGEAFESCTDILSDVGFGGGGGALRGSAEFQDALLAVTDCVRDEGFENVSAPGPGPGGAGGGQPNGGAGAGQQDDGARGSRLAAQMGLDSEDPAVIAAMDTCLPILDEVLAGIDSAGQD